MADFSVWSRESLERLAEDLTDRAIQLNHLRSAAEELIAAKSKNGYTPHRMWARLEDALDMDGSRRRKLKQEGFERSEDWLWVDQATGFNYHWAEEAMDVVRRRRHA
jgi:hypothetical protein